MSDDLLAGVEAAAGLAVYGGGSPASALRGSVALDRWSGYLDPFGTGAARDLLPQLAELCAELADLDEVVVAGPATAASALARSLGVRLTVLADDPPRVADAVADPHRLAGTLLVLTEAGPDLRPPFWAAHLAAGRTEAEAGRHFVAVARPGSPFETRARELGILTMPATPADGPFGAATLVPAALAGVDVADLLDQAEALVPSLSAERDNPALALALALRSAPQPIAVRSDGTGFEGLGEWIVDLLGPEFAVAAEGTGASTVTYGGALLPDTVPGGGTRPDIAVNGPLGAQLLAWGFAAQVAKIR